MSLSGQRPKGAKGRGQRRSRRRGGDGGMQGGCAGTDTKPTRKSKDTMPAPNAGKEGLEPKGLEAPQPSGLDWLCGFSRRVDFVAVVSAGRQRNTPVQNDLLSTNAPHGWEAQPLGGVRRLAESPPMPCERICGRLRHRGAYSQQGRGHGFGQRLGGRQKCVAFVRRREEKAKRAKSSRL